jgi:hypothetical protein
MRKTKSAKPQPEYYEEIRRLERQIPRKILKRLQREADLREYSDWEYLDFLQGYLDNPEESTPE